MDREHAKRTMLRIIVAIVATLGTASFVFGFFPGFDVYSRVDNTFLETRPVVEDSRWFFGFLVILLGPGISLWRTPKIGYALLWSAWTIVISALAAVAAFDMQFGLRLVALAPNVVFGVLMFVMLFMLIAGIPIASALFWWLTRNKPTPPVVLPVARLVKSRA